MTFDPYLEWLHIPVERRPPSHYELLGLAPGPVDPVRLEAAIMERMAVVRKYHAGARGDEAVRLCDELTRAYGCLNDAANKRDYDAALFGTQSDAPNDTKDDEPIEAIVVPAAIVLAEVVPTVIVSPPPLPPVAIATSPPTPDEPTKRPAAPTSNHEVSQEENERAEPSATREGSRWMGMAAGLLLLASLAGAGMVLANRSSDVVDTTPGPDIGKLTDVTLPEPITPVVPLALLPIVDQQVREGQLLTVSAALAPDFDKPYLIRYALRDAPPGMKVNPVSGEIQWTPDESQGGKSQRVTVIAQPPSVDEPSAETSFSVHVAEVNSPPVPGKVADQVLDRGMTLVAVVRATDSDEPKNTLRYSLEVPVPPGATIDAATGRITWQPATSVTPGGYPFTVRVRDDGSPAAEAVTTFQVRLQVINQPPVVFNVGPRSVVELQPLAFKVSANDPDGPSEKITYTLEPGAPSGARLDASTGDFTWTPTEAQGPGTHRVVMTATDQGTPPAVTRFTVAIGVQEDNQPPVIGTIASRPSEELEDIRVELPVTDLDEPPQRLTYRLLSSPPNATVGADGIVHWTPSLGMARKGYGFRVEVSDGYGINDTCDFTIQVTSATKYFTNSRQMKMLLIPPGQFIMGHDASGSAKSHTVGITKAFYMSAHEVTQADFERVMGDNPSFHKGPQFGNTQSLPVENVTHHEAVEFCRKLSQSPSEVEKKRVYRLPTEAEWEYACRAGGAFEFAESDKLNPQFANVRAFGMFAGGQNPSRTTRVGSYNRANKFGMFDMHGNVSEWVADWYSYSYYDQSPATDPTGPATGSNRVHRGGSFSQSETYAKCYTREDADPDERQPNRGFRIVCER